MAGIGDTYEFIKTTKETYETASDWRDAYAKMSYEEKSAFWIPSQRASSVYGKPYPSNPLDHPSTYPSTYRGVKIDHIPYCNEKMGQYPPLEPEIFKCPKCGRKAMIAQGGTPLSGLQGVLCVNGNNFCLQCFADFIASNVPVFVKEEQYAPSKDEEL